MAKTGLTFNTVAREICKREKSQGREVNITDVSRVMRHPLHPIRYIDGQYFCGEHYKARLNQYIVRKPCRIKR